MVDYVMVTKDCFDEALKPYDYKREGWSDIIVCEGRHGKPPFGYIDDEHNLFYLHISFAASPDQ